MQSGKMYTLSDLDDLYSNAKQNMRAYQQIQSRQVSDYINTSLQHAKVQAERVSPKTQRGSFLQMSDPDYKRGFPSFQI